MRRALLYGLGTVVVTVPFTWLWMQGGFEAYARAFESVAGAIYALLGLERAQPLARQRYVNWIPFVALVLLTPSLGWRRRGVGLVGGLVALFAAHVLFNALAPYLSGGDLAYPTALALVSDALPFLLWLWIARDWVRRRVQGGSGTTPPAAESRASQASEVESASGPRSPTTRGRTGPGSP